MSSAPVIDPGPPPPAPSGLPTRSDRFFSWSAGLGLVRGDGWIGGVATALAVRTRVDPLIVRGILVVVALFGFPVVLLYGVAWALLPDLDGRIPLQDAFRGRFAPSQIGVAVFVIAGLVPPPTLWWGLPSINWLFYAEPGWFALLLILVIAGLLVAGGLVFLIVRAARRTPPQNPGVVSADLRTASADSAAPAPSDVEPGREPATDADPRGVDALTVTDTASLPAPSVDPPTADAGDAGDPPDDLAAWREQHAAWKEQDQHWRQEQQDATRAAREQARRERQARATAFAAEAAERRRIRRATSPRTPFAYVAVAIGAAVVIGTVVALQQGGELAPALGLFTGALVLAASMVLAGVVRRRSGFLAFVTLLTLVGGAGALALPAALALHVGSYGISNTGAQRYPSTAPFVQPWGDLSVYLDDTGVAGQTYVDKRSGTTLVSIEPGVEVTVEVTTRAAALYLTGTTNDYMPLADQQGVTTTSLPDGRVRYSTIVSDDDVPITTREKLVIDQESGFVEFYLLDRTFEGDQP